MNKHIRELSKQILTIEEIATLFRPMAGKQHPEQTQDYMGLVNIIVRLTENADMRLLEARWEALLETSPATSEEAEEHFAAEAIAITTDAYVEVLRLHKDNKLILWQPGKGAVLVNGN